MLNKPICSDFSGRMRVCVAFFEKIALVKDMKVTFNNDFLC
ncbi:hypothetical protein [Flavobacterium sp. MEB061]|nr:hypothetical protein [Flavobacterium sp. MEB061]